MSRVARVALCLGAMVCSVSAAAQDLSLTRDCEVGFRQFISLAEAGRLGTDVSDANVAIADNQVRVELVRAGAPNKLLFLTRKRSPEPEQKSALRAAAAPRVGRPAGPGVDAPPSGRARDGPDLMGVIS